MFDPAKVIHAFSNRSHGNMSLSYADTRSSLENRSRFLSGLGIDFRSLVCAKQVHSGVVSYVREEDKGRGALTYEASIPGTDAFVTDKKNIPLAIFTADCLSVFLYDPNKPAVGLVHAGWRSSNENILGKAIAMMQKEFGANPEDILLSFGPAIRECCYEVSGDFSGFSKGDLIKRGSRFYLDLAKINKTQAKSCGIKDENVADKRLCTCCRNEEFFSFRKEKDACGRMLSVIMLR